MTNAYTATRIQEGVPAWDLKDARSDFVIGYMTDFPGEGPVATVRLSKGDDGTTVKATTLHTCLFLAREAYEGLYDAYELSHDYIEDEDGEMARMRYEENKANDWASRREMDEPDW